MVPREMIFEKVVEKEKLSVMGIFSLSHCLLCPFRVKSHHLTLSQTTKFRLTKLKEFAGDKFKFNEKGRKLSKQIENTVGKGEITRYEQFLLFPQCFQKSCTADT